MIFFPAIPDSAWLLLGILIVLAAVWFATFALTDWLRRKVLKVSYTYDSTDAPQRATAWIVTIVVGLLMHLMV